MKVYDTQKPDCAYDEVGAIEATSGSVFSMGQYASTRARLQEQAADLGADGVIVTGHFKNGMADQASGVAIRCKR